jgi:hypothetical protein
MQDPRIRIAAASILSIAAFISLQGAAAAFLWWLVFTPRFRIVKKIRLVFSLILMIVFFSLVLELFGGNGFSYFCRMTVIILIGMWVFAEQQSGEFLAISVWLFGTRTGFELGMVAEMGIQSLSSVTADLDRIRIAEKIKGRQKILRSCWQSVDTVREAPCVRHLLPEQLTVWQDYVPWVFYYVP